MNLFECSCLLFQQIFNEEIMQKPHNNEQLNAHNLLFCFCRISWLCKLHGDSTDHHEEWFNNDRKENKSTLYFMFPCNNYHIVAVLLETSQCSGGRLSIMKTNVQIWRPYRVTYMLRFTCLVIRYHLSQGLCMTCGFLLALKASSFQHMSSNFVEAPVTP